MDAAQFRSILADKQTTKNCLEHRAKQTNLFHVQGEIQGDLIHVAAQIALLEELIQLEERDHSRLKLACSNCGRIADLELKAEFELRSYQCPICLEFTYLPVPDESENEK